MMERIPRFLVILMAVLVVDVDGCRTVRISNTCPPTHASGITTYSITNITSSDHPVYKSDTGDSHLNYIPDSGTASGKWVVSNIVGATDDYSLYVDDDHNNPDEITETFFTLVYGVWKKSKDVKISCTGKNVALGKPASQSSTDGSKPAALAVDGEKGTSTVDSQCTLTRPEPGPWWQVDLGRDSPVGSVRILNRGDCCGGRLHNFVVEVKREGRTSWEMCGAPYDETPTNGQSIMVDCGRPIVGRYVRIRLPTKSDALSLCEVEVFTDLGCPSGYIVHAGTCYKPFNTPKTRHDASTTCQQDGGTLATPRHRDTNVFLTNLAILVDSTSTYWIGLSKESIGWVWDGGSEPCGFRGWGAGQPSTKNYTCAALRVDSSWKDESCEATAKFFCQVKPPVDLADVGYQPVGEAFFRAFPVKKTFDEAITECELFGGSLARPVTNGLNNQLKGIIGEASAVEAFWIGMTTTSRVNDWSWQDGTPSDTSYSSWATEEPSGEGCGMMTAAPSNNWRVGDCEETAFYVCQIGHERSCGEGSASKVYCGGSTSEQSGNISSPGYAENRHYPNNHQCEWKITVEKGKIIKFTFEVFELEQNDHLAIYDVCRDGHMNANLTGSDIPSPIITNFNRATVVFNSDGLYTMNGFNIHYQAITPPRPRPERGLQYVQAQVTRPKRAVQGVIRLGIGILSNIKQVFGFFGALEGNRQNQQVMNTLNRMESQLQDISQKLAQLAIEEDLRHEIAVAAAKYADSVQNLKSKLDTLGNDLYVTNGTVWPEDVAQRLANALLGQDSDGVKQNLDNLFEMMMGSSGTGAFEGRSIIAIMDDKLRLQNMPTAEYRTKLETISGYYIYLHAGGFGAWVFALKQTGQENQIDGVLRNSYSKLSQQTCFVAPFFYEWPAGTFGLPMPTSGCPPGSSVTWKEGQYEHKGGSFQVQQNAQLHLNGSISSSKLSHGFCMKVNASGSNENWPPGMYCILNYDHCPIGFRWGKLGFPGGTKTGVVPDGSSDSGSIEIEYCCRGDGNASEPIRLPPRHPFYMLRYGKECQKVEETVVRDEWVEYRGNGYRAGVTPDDEGNDDSHKLYYCYYSLPGSNNPQTVIVSAAVLRIPSALLLVSCVTAVLVSVVD